MLRALGRALHRHARWFAVGWLVLTFLGFALATGSLGNQSLFDRLHAGSAPTVPGDSQVGWDLLTETSPTAPPVVLIVDGIDPADTAVADEVETTRAKVQELTGVASVADPYQVPAGLDRSPLVASDGRAILVSVSPDKTLTESANDAVRVAVTQQLRALGDALTPSGATYRVGGVPELVDEINHHVETDLRIGEAVALPLSLLVMVVVFGGLLAAGMPILGAIASISGGLAVLLAFSYVIELEASVPSVVTVLGLGLCIDYGLLLVSRYREELRRLGTGAATEGRRGRRDDTVFAAAMENTMVTAGRTVAFSGLTVAISLAGLMLFRAEVLRAIGAAGVSIVVVAVLVALTLVPALLALAGPRLLRLGVSHRVPGLRRVARRLGDVAPEHGAFSRLAGAVRRRPLLVALACLAVLGAAAAPILRMEMVSSGVSLLPATSEQRLLLEDLADRFPATSEAPIQLVTHASPEASSAWAQTELPDTPGLASVDPVQTRGSGAEAISVIGVRPDTDPRLTPARQVVDEIRDTLAATGGIDGEQVWVTGETAQVHDFIADIRERAPFAVGIVALATLVLLFLMTGSVLIPIKALFMNVVSLGASLGVLVWVFQDGHLQGLLDFSSNGGIDQNVPPLALAFAFGLSMDYEVFLLSRIKEARDAFLTEGTHTRRISINDAAVARGLQRSGRIITSAALIIVIVFLGFVAGQLLLIKQIGVAMAVAVAIDATIVRMLLVPATMTLLGEWNWWAPAPLRRLHARFGVSEG